MAAKQYDAVPNRHGKSIVWKYFGLKCVDGKVDSSYAVCYECKSFVKTSGGTTNLSTHLRRHHPMAIATKTSKLHVASAGESSYSSTTSSTSQQTLHVFTNRNKQFKSNSTEAQQITHQMALFLVKGLHPFSLIDSSEFRSLLSLLQPRYSVPSRKQFAEVIVPKLYHEVRSEIASKMQKAVKVSLTTDGWTSRATDDYVTVTSSFVNDDWKLETFVLQTRPLGESHTADNLADVLKEVMREWKVGDTNTTPTRWNSSYEMLQRYLEMQLAVITTLRSKELGPPKDLNTISDEDLTLMEELVNFLQPIKEITVLMCYESCPTISIIQPIRHQLLQSVLIQKEGDSPPIRDMKKIMMDDLSNRYTVQKEMLSLASAIDPRFKILPYFSAEERFDVYSKLTTQVAAMWDSVPQGVKVKTEPDDEPALPQLPTETDTTETDTSDMPEEDHTVTVKTESSPPAKKQSKDCLLEDFLGDVFYIASEPAKSSLELAQADIEQYKSELPVPLSENPLNWWKIRDTKYPLLARFAKCVFCVPATSVPSERVFSTAGDIVTQQRASLKPEHVDMLVFLKKNLKK